MCILFTIFLFTHYLKYKTKVDYSYYALVCHIFPKSLVSDLSHSTAVSEGVTTI